MTGAQTGLGRSQSQAYTTTNDYIERQVEQRGRQTGQYVGQTKTGKQTDSYELMFSLSTGGWRSRSEGNIHVHVCVYV